jgi:enoyl-CoA hydratase/carnithine racemase
MSDASKSAETSVVARRDGRIGHLLLNRPKALNALDLDMIRALTSALEAWRDDPFVHAVVVEGAGDRAFCAGGDVRAIRAFALSGDTAAVENFFAEEYALNALIAEYPKPYIALIDGICMGGGIGVSVHGAIRVTTEAGMFAMPETAIAMFPDIGATYVLPRLPGELGMYLGLTGARVLGADAVHAGLATHFVEKAALPELRAELARDGAAAVGVFAEALPPFSLAPHRAAIDRCFSAESMRDVLRALEAEGEFGADTLATLRKMSPSAVFWSFAMIRRGARHTLRDCLGAELRFTRRVTAHPDFAEGVRAMVIDKDRLPKFSPATLENVDPGAIAEMVS